MPLYDYDCAACGRRVEVVHGVYAPGPTHCPNCGGGPLRKAISAAAVHYKGSGWAKKERRASVTGGGGKNAGETAAAESDAKDAGATTSAPKSDGGPDSGSDGSTPASDRPAATVKAGGTGTATKTD
jgi:putative FmdB family regulatory protein